MIKHFTLLILSIFLSNFLLAQVIDDSFTWDGLEREYRIFLPEDYEEGQSLPLVLNFHGFTSSAVEQQFYSGMDQVADTANFIVVYPEGIGAAWNVGWAFGSMEDDVGFVNALIDSMHVQYGVNLDRVYSCGMSNGGFFSYRLACELNDRIAKIASVTGSMLPNQASLCMPDNPIPVMQIHGTSDPVVAYEGSPGVSMPIEDLLETWRDLNGCTPVSDTIAIADTDQSDQSTAQLIQYRDCDDNVIMVFYKIFSGAHTWPGAPIVIGITNYDINASVEIWNFFNDQYPQEQTVDVEDLSIENLKQKVHIFPNPVDRHFTIYSSVENIESIRVFNMLGQTIYSNNAVNNKAFMLNNVDWNKGFYLVHTKTKNTERTLKLVKQ